MNGPMSLPWNHILAEDSSATMRSARHVDASVGNTLVERI